MAFSRLVFPLLVLSVAQCYASIPVFLWGTLSQPTLKSYPLVTISDQEFDSLLKRELKGKPFTIVFVEEALSVEDFSHKDAAGETSFPYLHANLGNSVYIPAVTDPLDGLSAVALSSENYITLTEDGLPEKIEPESGSFLFVKLRDARDGESRSNLLRRHNDFMQKTVNDLKSQYENIVAVYTGENTVWTNSDEEITRVRRQAEEEASPITAAMISFNSLKLYSERILVNNVDIRPTYVSGSSVIAEDKTSQNSTLRFADYTLTLKFVNERGYWLLRTIGLTRNADSTTEELSAIEAPYSLIDQSFVCRPNVTFTTINETNPYVVAFQLTKIQPYFNATMEPENLAFGDSFDCVGFFTAPIWAGLFVVFILIFILFIGLVMMMDIRTMDRFDDPKGKTITINPMDQ